MTTKAEVPWKLISTKDYDWNIYRTEYVTGSMTYETLCKKHGLNPPLVRKRASKEGWAEKRKEFREANLHAVAAEVTKASIETLVEYNTDVLVDANRLREAARRMFMKLENGKWAHRKDISYGALGAASSAMVNADKIARLALGVSTENRSNTHKNLPVSIEELV